MAQIDELEKRIEKLEGKLQTNFTLGDRFNEHTHNGTDSQRVRFTKIAITANSAITAPSGGATIDSEARTAINAIITELENRNFVKDN